MVVKKSRIIHGQLIFLGKNYTRKNCEHLLFLLQKIIMIKKTLTKNGKIQMILILQNILRICVEILYKQNLMDTIMIINQLHQLKDIQLFILDSIKNKIEPVVVKILMKMIYFKILNYYFKNSTIKSHCTSSNK